MCADCRSSTCMEAIHDIDHKHLLQTSAAFGSGTGFVVLFGIVVNVIMMISCYSTLTWVRAHHQHKMQGCMASSSSCALDDEEANVAGCTAKTTSKQPPMDSRFINPAIFASRDIDTQNMLLASASVNLFFKASSLHAEHKPAHPAGGVMHLLLL